MVPGKKKQQKFQNLSQQKIQKLFCTPPKMVDTKNMGFLLDFFLSKFRWFPCSPFWEATTIVGWCLHNGLLSLLPADDFASRQIQRSPHYHLGARNLGEQHEFSIGKTPRIARSRISSDLFIQLYFSMILPWFPMIFPWYSHDIPMIIHDFPMIFPWLSMIFPWFSHDFPMIFRWFPMIFQWFSHDFPMIFPWFSHDFPMIIHDFPMIFPWFSHDYPWFSHDFPMIFPWLSMIFPWFSHDFPMIIHDFPMIFPWFSHDYPWFSHDFPMIIHDFPMIWYGQNRSEAWDSKTPESFLMRRVSKNVGNPWPVLTYQIQMEWFHQHGVETKQNGHLTRRFCWGWFSLSESDCFSGLAYIFSVYLDEMDSRQVLVLGKLGPPAIFFGMNYHSGLSLPKSCFRRLEWGWNLRNAEQVSTILMAVTFWRQP